MELQRQQSTKLAENPFVVKHDVRSIDTVQFMSDEEIIVMGAHRKILYYPASDIFRLKERRLREIKMGMLGGLSETSNQEVKLIRCHPKDSKILGSVVGNNCLVWNLENPNQQTQTLTHFKTVSGIGWRPTEQKILATTSQDNSITLWDIRFNTPASRIINQEQSDVSLLSWKDSNVFASTHNKIVKLWDIRKLEVGQEIANVQACNSNVKNLEFDPQFGKLMIAQDKDCLKLFKVEQMVKLDEISVKKELLTSKFFPFKNVLTPGIVLLPCNSPNLLYLTIEDQRSKGDEWNLKLVQKRADLAGPQDKSKDQIQTSVDSFALRCTQDSQNQVVSVSSDSSLKIMTFYPNFIQEFGTQIDCLIDDDFESIVVRSAEKMPELTLQDFVNQQTTEIKQMNCVSFVDVQDNKMLIGLNAQSQSVQIFCNFPKDYPNRSCQLTIGDSFNITNEKIDQLQEQISLLSSQIDQNGEFNKPITILESLQNILQSPDTSQEKVVNENQPQQQKNFIPYLRTCSFAWNCYGEIVFFTNQKYNFENLKQRPEIKKIYNINDQQITLQNEIAEQDSITTKQKSVMGMVAVSEDNRQSFSSESSQEDLSYYDDEEKNSQESESSDDFILLKKSSMDQANMKRKKSTKVNQVLYLAILSQYFKPKVNIARVQLPQNDNCSNYCLEMSQRFAKNSNTEYTELAQIWQLLSLAFDLNHEKIKVWSQHPFGKGLIMNVFEKFEQEKNYQQIALIASVIMNKEISIYENFNQIQKLQKIVKRATPARLQDNHSTIGQRVSSFYNKEEKNKIQVSDDDNFQKKSLVQTPGVRSPFNRNFFDLKYEGSEKSSESELQIAQFKSYNSSKSAKKQILQSTDESSEEEFELAMLLIQDEPEFALQLLIVLKWYSELLHKWGEVERAIQTCKIAHQAAKILQQLNQGENLHDMLLFGEKSLGQGTEQEKDQELIKCSICEVTVRGLIYTCQYCNHGGHYEHLLDWFKYNQECPTGCGCKRCFAQLQFKFE